MAHFRIIKSVSHVCVSWQNYKTANSSLLYLVTKNFKRDYFKSTKPTGEKKSEKKNEMQISECAL